jgi:hypothetical protein
MPGRIIDLLVGGLLEDRGVLRCGKWRLFASFGVYGGKEIIRPLRIWRRPWRRFYPPFTTLCFFRLWYMCPLYIGKHHLVLVEKSQPVGGELEAG